MGEHRTAPRSNRREGAAQTVGTLVTPLDWVMLVMVCIGAIGATISYIHAYHPRRLKRETQHIPMTSPLLPAGLELDQRMAEEFMGLIPCGQWKGPYLQQGALLWEHTGPPEHRCYRRGDPAPYSRSWALAWEVLEELRRRQRVVTLTVDGRRRQSKDTVIIDQCPPIEAESLPHALALAALNTVKPERPPTAPSSSRLPSCSRLEQVVQVSVDEAVRGHVHVLTAEAVTGLLRDHPDLTRMLKRHITAALQDALVECERTDQAKLNESAQPPTEGL